MNFFSSPVLPEIRCSREGARYLVWHNKMIPISDDAVLEITYTASQLRIVVDGNEVASAECSAHWSERARQVLFAQRLAKREQRGAFAFIVVVGALVLTAVSVMAAMRPSANQPLANDASATSVPSVGSDAFARGVRNAENAPTSSDSIDLTDNTMPYVESCP